MNLEIKKEKSNLIDFRWYVWIEKIDFIFEVILCKFSIFFFVGGCGRIEEGGFKG